MRGSAQLIFAANFATVAKFRIPSSFGAERSGFADGDKSFTARELTSRVITDFPIDRIDEALVTQPETSNSAVGSFGDAWADRFVPDAQSGYVGFGPSASTANGGHGILGLETSFAPNAASESRLSRSFADPITVLHIADFTGFAFARANTHFLIPFSIFRAKSELGAVNGMGWSAIQSASAVTSHV